ncbi:GTP cyclohydrolase II [Hanseniaspora vineae]
MTELNNTTTTAKPLPLVKCIARARIPTVQGPDIFLHLYENNVDSKEHLAIVFGEDIRSRSLFKQRYPNESQYDRMIRGAYCGKLYPGRKIADTYYDPQDPGRVLMQLQFDPVSGELLPEASTTWNKDKKTMCRIHSECYTGETAWSARCDCGEQFDRAGEFIAYDGFLPILNEKNEKVKVEGGHGHGVIVYLRQEGRGIGLGEKLKAYNLQDLGHDTMEANLELNHPVDSRDFSIGNSILLDLGLSNIRLMTNNPQKLKDVEYPPYLHCVERIPMIPLSWDEDGSAESAESAVNDSSVTLNTLASGDVSSASLHSNSKHAGIHSKEVEGYLRTKMEKMGHLLSKPLNLHTAERS